MGIFMLIRLTPADMLKIDNVAEIFGTIRGDLGRRNWVNDHDRRDAFWPVGRMAPEMTQAAASALRAFQLRGFGVW
ncbi:hypothetical protein OPT61_g6116 [Boeremia exigua]|uniref:Uncharacterized protein n=1 Tax=Boeremia exigua TaxID=749465 RepID=A0ACC2I843_9PLEO|nr:hypothetical protein OPT61_g6116 [Boeremia exigua]